MNLNMAVLMFPGGGDMQDGHFIFDTSDVLDVMKNTNGVRSALWLRTE